MNSIEISQGGSNTDSGSKRGVQCRDSSILYLAFIVRSLFNSLRNLEESKGGPIVIEPKLLVSGLCLWNLNLSGKYKSNIISNIENV